MAIVIEQSNQAYEQRDKAQLEIAAIERLNRKEEDAYHQQVTDLSEELETINEQLLNSTKRNQTATVIDPAEEERKAAERRETARANEIARAEEEYAQQRKDKLESYEDAFQQISAATGISDVDELVKVFIENEEHNFSLFRYSNEQAAEIERLEEEIQALHEEEMRYKEEEDAAKNGHREEIAKLENEIKSVDDQTALYEAKCAKHQKILEEVKDEIKVRALSALCCKYAFGEADAFTSSCRCTHQLLLIRLDCKLGDEESGGIALTTDSILHYLGLIEERTMEIISNYQRMKEVSGRRQETGAASFGRDLRLEDYPGIAGAEPVTVNPPRLLDYSSDESGDEDADRPLYRAVLEKKISSRALSIASALPPKRKPAGRRGSLFQTRSTRTSLLMPRE